jgi:Flp pilus assembly protein TadD
VLESQGRYAEAADEFREVLRIDPDAPDARYNLANCLAAQGEFEEASRALPHRRLEPTRRRRGA